MALITFNPRYKGHRAMTVPADKAQTIYEQWKDPSGIFDDEKLDFLKCIEKIYFNNHGTAKTPDTSHLTHTGIEQGKNQALPIGDR